MISDLYLTTHPKNSDRYVTPWRANPYPICCIHLHACLNMHLWIVIILHSRWNIGPLLKHTYNTRLYKKMKNEEKTQLEAQHQKEMESLTEEVARPASLLEHPPNHHLQSRFCRHLQLSSIHQTWGQVEPRLSPNTLHISQLSLYTQWGSLMSLSYLEGVSQGQNGRRWGSIVNLDFFPFFKWNFSSQSTIISKWMACSILSAIASKSEKCCVELPTR